MSEGFADPAEGLAYVSQPERFNPPALVALAG